MAASSAPQHRRASSVNDLGLVHRLHAHMNAVVALEMSTLRTLTRSAGERLALGDFLVVCRQSFHVTRERFADEPLARVFRLLRDGDPDDGGASRATIAVGSLGYFLSIRPSRLGELLKLGLGAFKRHAERQSSVQSDRRRAAAANAGAADPPDVCASSTLSSFSTTASYSGRRAEPVIPFMNDARMAQARRSTGRVLQTSLRLYSPERPSRPGESARLPAGRPPVALATPIRSVPACRRVRAESGRDVRRALPSPPVRAHSVESVVGLRHMLPVLSVFHTLPTPQPVVERTPCSPIALNRRAPSQ